MKTGLLAAIAAAGLLGAPAFAADLAVKAPYMKAPANVPYDWTGFYLGVNAGLGVAGNPTTWSNTDGGVAQISNLGPFGAVGGGQLGYNWQQGNWVFGLETDIQGAGLRDNGGTCLLGCGTFLQRILVDQRLDWFGTVRGRIGITAGPVLSYLTGGFAYGNVNTTVTDQPAVLQNAATVTASFSQTRTGWTVGSGVEASLGGAWTGKLEYLLVDLGTQSGAFTVPFSPSLRTISSDIREQIIRAGVNYRFGGNPAYAASPLYNWGGLYVGGNVGGGIARDRTSEPTARTNGVITGAETFERFGVAPKGVLGGAQIGYNWQAANWVFGLETDIQGSSFKDNKNCGFPCAGDEFLTVTQSLPWLGTTRGRIGYSVGPSLFYLTGGAAYGGVKNQVNEASPGIVSFAAEFNHTKTGWTAGAGIESPFNVFGLLGPSWTVKTEYLFVDLGNTTDRYTFGTLNHVIDSRIQEHIFRSGLNYHFNAPGPVAARY
jgi:outer membrane immunogenic protein